MLFVLMGLVGCAPGQSDDASPTLVLRVVCGIQGWLERNDFRVRTEGVDRCSGAARQIEAGRERAREVLEETLDRRRDHEAPNPAQESGS